MHTPRSRRDGMLEPGSNTSSRRSVPSCPEYPRSRSCALEQRPRCSRATTIAFVVAGASLAHAQEPQANNEPPKDASDASGQVISETEVTGVAPKDGDVRTRTNTSAVGVAAETDKLPVSLTTVSARVIEDQQAFRLEDIFRNSPNVQESPTKGNTQSIHVPFIRGFQTGGVYRNGLFLHQNGINVNTSNIERVEILKGPQSVMFGLMQPGGAVNYVTKKPLASSRAEFDAIFDQHGRKESRADLGGPLSSDGSLRYRLNLAAYDSDLFTDTEYAEGFMVSPEIEWDISEQTMLSVSASYIDEDRLEQGFVGLRQDNGQLAWDPGTFIGATGLPGKDQQELILVTTLTHALSDDLRLRVQGGYHKFGLEQLESFVGTFGGVPPSGDVDVGVQKIDQDSESWTWRGDVQWSLETETARHQLTFGLDHNRHDQDRRQAVDDTFYGTVNVFSPTLPNGAANPFTPASFPKSESERDWTGVYAQDLVSLFDDELHLLANVRYDTFDQTNVNFSGVATQFDAHDVTTRLGVLWNATQWLAPYASWSESFVPTSARTVGGELLDPEEGEQYEAGVKLTLLEDQLTATLCGFRIDRDNMPIDDPSSSAPGSINGGLFRSDGGEIELVGRITDNLQVLAGFGLLDAEVVRSSSLTPGSRLQGVPKRSANLWLSYDFDEGPLDGLGLGGGLFYRSDIITQFSTAFELDSYVTADFSTWYRRPLADGVLLRMALTLMNAFDEQYGVGGFGGGVQAGQPRTLVGSVGVTLGV